MSEPNIQKEDEEFGASTDIDAFLQAIKEKKTVEEKEEIRQIVNALEEKNDTAQN